MSELSSRSWQGCWSRLSRAPPSPYNHATYSVIYTGLQYPLWDLVIIMGLIKKALLERSMWYLILKDVYFLFYVNNCHLILSYFIILFKKVFLAKSLIRKSAIIDFDVDNFHLRLILNFYFASPRKNETSEWMRMRLYSSPSYSCRRPTLAWRKGLLTQPCMFEASVHGLTDALHQ